jgi:hypothetical protein
MKNNAARPQELWFLRALFLFGEKTAPICAAKTENSSGAHIRAQIRRQ